MLDKDETFGFLMLSNKMKVGFLNIRSDDLGEIGVDIIRSRTKTYASAENGKVVLHAKIKADLMLDAVEHGYINTITAEHLEGIEQLVEEKIKKYCISAFDECIKGQSDCLRIGENLAMRHPKDYDKLSDDWKSSLSDAELDLDIKCKFKKINENSKGD